MALFVASPKRLPKLLFKEYRGSFLGVKRLRRNGYHSHLPAAEVKNDWSFVYFYHPYMPSSGEEDNLLLPLTCEFFFAS
jgi:hypothetical protein